MSDTKRKTCCRDGASPGAIPNAYDNLPTFDDNGSHFTNGLGKTYYSLNGKWVNFDTYIKATAEYVRVIRVLPADAMRDWGWT